MWTAIIVFLIYILFFHKKDPPKKSYQQPEKNHKPEPKPEPNPECPPLIMTDLIRSENKEDGIYIYFSPAAKYDGFDIYFNHFLVGNPIERDYCKERALDPCNSRIIRTGGVGFGFGDLDFYFRAKVEYIWRNDDAIFEYMQGDRKAPLQRGVLLCKIVSAEGYPTWLENYQKTQEKAAIRARELKKKRRRDLEKEVLAELQQEEEFASQSDRRPPIPKDVADAVYRRDGGKCVYCGSTEFLQFDHIIPFSKGGDTTVENLQILCRSCNIKKSNKIG